MFEKYFKVKVSMGDGKPIDDIIPAKNGVVAIDAARDRHPGARSVYILGISEIRSIKPATVSAKKYKPMDDIVIGGARNDKLDGGLGADTMIGGTWNDTYVVDNAGDVVIEDFDMSELIAADTVQSASSPEP